MRFHKLARHYASVSGSNWAFAVAQSMEAASIDWVDDPDASVNSRDDFERYLRKQWNTAENCSDPD